MAKRQGMTRRDFLALSGASSVALVSGCATNPVTGRRQVMFVSEAAEVDLDRKWAPHQFSADYGASQDSGLNEYVAGLGNEMGVLTHRPHMPYNFRVVNSCVVNGYTMPAGSVGLCRGLMLEMKSEAELAAVLGHELGHVNARHAGARMTKGMLAQVAVAGLAAYVEHKKEEYAPLAAGLGMVGSQLLLSRYSRDDERQADALGMEYMTRAGHNPQGMAGLMETFVNLHDRDPGIVELLFSTHPMSKQRYAAALQGIDSQYAVALENSKNTERYMDHTVRLRGQKTAIREMQKGEMYLMGKKYKDAESLLLSALKKVPDDYAGLLMTAKCYLAQGQAGVAEGYARRARDIYPEEPQALHVMGIARSGLGRFDAALADFSNYESLLPGNPNTIYYKGHCLEKMGRKEQAAAEFMRYRKEAPSGEFSSQATSKLTDWGYIVPEKKPAEK